MKKKIKFLILSVLFVLPLAVFLISCGEKKGEQPLYINDISVEIDDTHYSEQDQSFVYTYGEDIEIEKTNFTVTITYTDPTVEPKILTQDEFTIDTSSLVKNEENKVDAGYYSVNVVYNEDTNFNKPIAVRVDRKYINLSYIEGNLGDIYIYDGTSKDALDYVKEIPVPDGNDTIEDMLSQNIIEINDSTTEINAGSYYFCINATDNYTFSENEISSTKIVNWGIDRQVITGAASQTQYTFAYNDDFEAIEQEIEINWSVDNAEDLIDLYNYKFNYVGDFDCFAMLNQEGILNYKFVDENNQEIFVYNIASWKIVPAELKKPVMDVEDEYQYTYNTEIQKPTITIDEETAKFFDATYSNENSTDVGNYHIYVSKKDEVDGILGNFVWEGTTQVVNSFYYFYSIEKATSYKLPNDFNENVVARITFDFIEEGTSRSLILSPYGDFTTETNEYLTENGLIDSPYYDFVLDEDVVIREVGTYENVPIKFCKDYYNYEYQDATITVIVDKLDVEINPTWQKDYQYTPDVYSLDREENISNDLIEIDAREELGILQVGQTQYLYRANNTDEWQVASNRLNAGFYKSKVEVAFDENCNIVMSEYDNTEIVTENGKTYLLKEWSIEKVQCYPAIGWETNNKSYSTTSQIYAFETGNDIIVNAAVYGIYVNYQVSYQTFYKANIEDSYVETDDLSQVGFYKTIATITFDDVNGYYNEEDLQEDVVASGNTLTCEKEWEILSTTIDLSQTRWAGSASVVHGTEYDPYDFIENLPKGVSLEFWYWYDYSSQNYKVESVGNYYIYAYSVSANSTYEGYENVTIINQEDFLDYNNFEEGGSFLKFEITPLTLTAEFLLTRIDFFDGNTQYMTSNFTVSYTEGVTWKAMLAYWNLIETEEIQIQYIGDNEASEIGDYSFTVIVPKEACSRNVTFEGDTLEFNVTWHIV